MKLRIRNKKLVIGIFAALIAFTMVATAGLLSMYGKVETTATVQQSVVLWDGSDWVNYDTPISEPFGDVTGGSCECSAQSILNRADVEAPITVETSITKDESWVNPDPSIGGVDVEYIVGYWNVAGHTFPSLDDYDGDLVVPTDYSDIQYVFNNNAAEEGDVICVQSGTYNGFTVDVDGVTVVSDGATIEGQIKIDANDVTIEGFEVIDAYDNAIWLMQGITGATIRNNYIHDTEDKINYEDSSTGIYLESGAMTDTVIEYNTIEYNFAGIGGTEDFVGEINYNVIKNNDEGIGVGYDGFSTYRNIFENNVADFRVYVDNLNSIDGKDNYYGCDGPVIDYKETTGSWVNAQHETLDSSFTLQPGEQLDFVIKYCFDVAIEPGDYTITTEFQPDN